ncbi:unnamed protein product (macronuclear) [Paramecium tetraurelia]|uniref:SMP-30/Gluconolactonase/LRE-like region domain-containing protein n=1 Tax=Paramecium tetraurelia TaxID=5888 RepID=A0D7N9_PARTE|nr:uncharacterized protein GSPATT00014023001 [Paramecium tetraurelia]CAK79056.1 unnamed protein product [Paramecium tetraurelia]|eukprot:XP_001446453.1 hypothetical protein (macronuclear) [Paramecium tetraurelia strain d4-2]
MQVTVEKICSFSNPLSSPHEVNGCIYMVSENGDILVMNNELTIDTRMGGQPSSIAIERDHILIYIADMAHQAITYRQLNQLQQQSNNQNQEGAKDFVTEYEGMPFLGPNQIVISYNNLNAVFFTDSGPFGETNVENPIGSVFMVDLDGQEIKPTALAYRCLAHPSGLALSHDEKSLFVSETCENRIIRFVLTNAGIYAFSVYHQFSGRFGPTALVISQSDFLYVARFEFSVGNENEMGLISVLNPQGQLLENILIPGSPEITGMCFSLIKPTNLYLTDNSNGSNRLIKCVIPLEDKDEEKKKKDKDSYKVK